MGDKERPGPRTTAARATVEVTTTDAVMLRRQLRLRREAAARCAPLEDGRRDPIMDRRRTT